MSESIGNQRMWSVPSTVICRITGDIIMDDDPVMVWSCCAGKAYRKALKVLTIAYPSKRYIKVIGSPYID